MDPDEVARHWDVSRVDRSVVPPFRTPCFDRTLSEWVAMIIGAGLAIEAMGEPRADTELAQAQPIVADTAVAPLFLHVRARKPTVDSRRSVETPISHP